MSAPTCRNNHIRYRKWSLASRLQTRERRKNFQGKDVLSSSVQQRPAHYVRGRPLVYDAHEYFTETPEVVRRPVIRTAWEWLAGELIPKLKYGYTVGPQLARLFEERYKIPFAVIRNLPTEKIWSEENNSSNRKVLLYQGMLNEGRGLESAIRAMPLLPPEVQLWLAGNGDIKTNLERLVDSLDLVGRVRFYGFVPPADLPLLTSQAWLGLNLLENKGLSYYYSLANKAFDYIQAGIPSVHMDFPEYRALQDQYGVFVLLPDLEPARFAWEVQLLLDDPLRYGEIARNCRRAARELTWEREEEKLLAFYRDIV